jgi:hypothetical protein
MVTEGAFCALSESSAFDSWKSKRAETPLDRDCFAFVVGATSSVRLRLCTPIAHC